MQQQARAWLKAVRMTSHRSRTKFYRLLIFSLLAPILVTVVPAPPAMAATLAASDGYCTQTINSTSGVSVIHDGNSCVVIFSAPSNVTTSNTWTVPNLNTTYAILVVGGGGSGGVRHGAGGGAGGYVYQTGISLTSASNISISVGKGGDAVATNAANGNSGTASSFSTYSAAGGGFGGQPSAGGNGGSGGGGCCTRAAGLGNTPSTSPSQGNNGGTGTHGNNEWNWSGGGGGGSGSVGGNSTSTSSIAGAGDYITSGTVTGGAGGNGTWNSISGTAACYAAGGGGGVASTGANGGAGGKCDSTTVGGRGGKGPNGTSPNYLATQGTDGTGSGGGGGGFEGGTNSASGRGGSGIVIVRYDLPVVTLNVNSGSGFTGSTSLTVAANGTVTLPAAGSMVRSGFTFAGWNTAANGTGTNYAAGASYTPSANVTLYAQWNSTISYNSNGATTSQSVLSTTAVGSGGTTTLSNGLGTGSPVSNGLVLNLDASDPTSISGTTWINKSSSGLANATIVGSPKYDPTDGSFQLNGVDQYFNLGTADYAYVGLTAFSVGISFNSTDPNTTSCLLARYNGNVAGSYMLRMISNGQLGAFREVSPWSALSASGVIQAGNSYYASMTYDGTNIRGYLNGTLVAGPTAMGSVYASTIATLIGGCQYNTALNLPFKGKIYNAQIYNRALSATEVQTNFQNLLGGRRIGKTNYTLGPWTTSADTGTAYGNPMQFDISALPTPYFRLNADSFINSSTPLVPSVGASNLSITSTGTIVGKASGGGGNGANARFATIGGTTSGGIRLGNAEVKNYTLCTLARYAPKSDGSTGSKGRLIANYSTTGNNNWFSGWYSGATRQFHHGAWILMPTEVDDDWHLSCDSGNTIYWDGVLQTTGVTPQAYTSLPQLAINWDYYGQNSDWEFAEMIVYDSVLSPSQMNQISRYFTNRYGLINVASAVTSAAAPSNVADYASSGSTTLYASWNSTITYDANEATSGSVPANQTIWNTGGTVAGNTGSLIKTGYLFNGWNTAANGTGTRYAVGAPLINDGNKVLYAQWVLPVNFPVASINPSSLAPYQRFIASDYDATNKIWRDSSGNGRNAGRVAGTPSLISTTANTRGAAKSFKVLSGDTAAKIWFGNAPLTPNWTVFALTRYSGATQRRILSGDSDRSSSNILIGQYNGMAGLAHINGWITSEATPAGINVTDWIMSTAFPYNYRLNGVSRGTSGGTNIISALGINSFSGQESNFEVAEVIIFDRTLTSSEINQVEDYFDETYGLAYPKVGTYKTTNNLIVANSVGGRSDTYTATDGFGTKTFSMSPTIPGITLDVSVTNNVAVLVAPTLAVGTYNETITATDAAGNSIQFPYQVTVVNPLVWSSSNPNSIITSFGKPTRTRLDLSGGTGTRISAISHLSNPAPRGVTIDTSTIATGFITLVTDTATAPGTYVESITVTDSSLIVKTLIVSITVNAPPDINYSAQSDAEYPILTSNLFLHYDFSNLSSYSGSGTTITDLRGNALSGTISNASIFSANSGGYVSLNGTNRATIQHTPFSNSQSFSKFLWIYPTSLTGSIIDVCDNTSCNSYHESEFELFNGVLYARAYNAGTVNSGSNLVTLNAWNYVGFTWEYVNSSTQYLKLYLNGQVVGSATQSTGRAAPTAAEYNMISLGDSTYMATNASGTFRLGAYHVYKSAITPLQARQNFQNTKPRFLGTTSSSPTFSGNVSLSTTAGKATTYQLFTETGGTGVSTFALSGSNSTFSLGSIAADQTSLIVGSATTATNSITAKTYYETLTATDSAAAATAYYLTITVNPQIIISATADTVTTTFGRVAYDTLTTTASTGTGNITFTRVSSSGSSAITHTSTVGSQAQAVMTIGSTLPAGTYYETFTATDSVGATTIKVITIVVNPAISIVSATGSATIETTFSKSADLRLNIFNGSGSRTYSFSVTNSSSPWKFTLDTSTAASNYVTFRVATYASVGTHTFGVTVTDAIGVSSSINITAVINDYPIINGIPSENSYATSGLIFNLDAANPSSSSGSGNWRDLSGAGNSATFLGSTVPAYQSNVGGGSFYFDGTNSYLTFPNVGSSLSGATTALRNFTAEVWVRFNRLSDTNACLICESYASVTNINMALYLDGNGRITAGYHLSNGAGWTQYSTANNVLSANVWTHVAMTISNSGSTYTTRIYVNGIDVGGGNSTNVPNSSGYVYNIGKRWDSTDRIQGNIGIIRVYNRGLSSSEMLANYNALKPRYVDSNLLSATYVTTQGAARSTPAITATLGTGIKSMSIAPVISGISGDYSVQNSVTLTGASSLTSADTQTARTYIETITATDSASATTTFRVNFVVNPPIIETATSTLLITTSGIETSTIIYATRGSSDKTFTRTGTSLSGITLTPGTNQATLRVLSTINPGTYWETVTASDTAGATTSIVIQVVVSPPPSMLGSARIETTRGVVFKSPLYSISGGTGTLAMSLVNSPSAAGITLVGTTTSGGFLQVDSSTAAGTYVSTVRVTDARGAFSELAVTIVINAPVTLSGSLSITKTYGNPSVNGYSTNGTGTAPFSFAGSPVCAVVRTVSDTFTYERINGTDSCTWTAPVGVSSIDALLVGGGGGGGPDGGAGGGGGSLNTLSNVSLPANRQISVQVGAGGTGGVYSGTASTSGGTSSITSGANTYTAPGGSGGNGCGSAASAGGVAGSGGTAQVGGNGGFGSGGAGCASPASGQNGFAGPSSSFTGSSVNYGGGGGGGPYPNSTAVLGPASGGAGGGGSGAQAIGNSPTGGLNFYFRDKDSGGTRFTNTVPNATLKQAFTTGTCATLVGAMATDWGSGAPAGCQADYFQGYGTGFFKAPISGYITFHTSSDDSSDLYIGGSINQELQLSDCCRTAATSTAWGPFVEGQYYPIQVYMTEIAGLANWTISYSWVAQNGFAAQSQTPIPAGNLSQTGTAAAYTDATSGTNGLGGGGGAGAAGVNKTAGGRGGSGVVIIKYLTQPDSATDTMITAVVNQTSPSGLLTLNVPSGVPAGSYTQTIKVQDAANSPTYQATVTITVNKAIPTVRLSLPGSVATATYGTPVTLTALASTSGTVLFKKSGSAISNCSSIATSNGLATCTWTPNLVETATITAQLSPTDSTNFNNSVETATSLTVVVGRADTLTVTASNLTATYSESGGTANTTIPARTYSLSGLASIDSITSMSYDFAGTINGGTNYATSATAPQQAGSYTITPKSPVFSTGATTNYSRVDFIAGTLTINRASRGAWSATYGAGTNVITYGPGKTETPTVTFPGDGSRAFSTSSTTCSVNTLTGVLTTLGVGSCDIQIVLPQTSNWLSDTKTVTVTINRGLRTATITPALTTIKYGDTTSVTTTILPALDSATVTFSNNSSLGCSVDNVNGMVTGVKAAAACSVRVTFDRTDLYESATATASITINRATAPVVTTETVTSVAYTGSIALVTPTYRVSGILARDISQILPLADVSSVSSIASIAATSYSTVASYRYFATTPTAYDSTTAPSLGGTYAVTPQNLTLLSGLDIGNYETPTYQSSNLVITPIQQAAVRITLSYLESVTVPFDVTFQGGSSTSAPTLAVIAGGTAQGCSVDVGVSAMRLRSSSAGTCIIQVTKPADRNYLVALSDTQTVNILNFVVNVIQLFDNNPTGIAINSQIPFTVGDVACTVACVPTVTAIQDLSGNAMTDMKVGLPFRLIGTNFNTASRVLFTATIGGARRSAVPADSFQIDSDTQITVLPPTSFVPNGTEATSNITVRIVVVASGGQSFPNSSITTISL